MDGRPSRTTLPADRRVVNRPEQAYRPPEEPQSVRAEPENTSRAALPHRPVQEKRRRKRFILSVIAIIIIVGAASFFVVRNMQSTSSTIDSSKYQAVFLSNGQVYFGKLHMYSNDYMTLTDIFYLQTQSSSTSTSTNPQETSSDQSNVQLIKLGNEIHGPEDEMTIAKDQILFYENLKPSGKVTQSIDKYTSTNK